MCASAIIICASAITIWEAYRKRLYIWHNRYCSRAGSAVFLPVYRKIGIHGTMADRQGLTGGTMALREKTSPSVARMGTKARQCEKKTKPVLESLYQTLLPPTGLKILCAPLLRDLAEERPRKLPVFEYFPGPSSSPPASGLMYLPGLPYFHPYFPGS